MKTSSSPKGVQPLNKTYLLWLEKRQAVWQATLEDLDTQEVERFESLDALCRAIRQALVTGSGHEDAS